MTCQLAIAPYRRPFATPLRTATGIWSVREGWLLRLEDRLGRVGYGEVAPLPAFGSETLERAEAFLRALGPRVERAELAACPAELPATAFALGSALWMLEEPELPFRFENTALLPTGEGALEALEALAGRGFRVFKLKLGVASPGAERALVARLLARLPAGGRLRLDANGTLEEAVLGDWLAFLAGEDGIDFLEQPLPVGAEGAMQAKAAAAGVALALDESVVAGRLASVVETARWTGPLVLKGSLLGDPRALVRELAPRRQRKVFSSAFETALGLVGNLRLAARAGADEAVGFGTLAYFTDGLGGFGDEAVLASETVGPAALEKIWETVCGACARS